MTSVLIARFLQPDGRGQYAMIVTMATVAVIIGNFTVVYTQIAFWKDGTLSRALTANGLLLGLGLGSAVALCTFAVSPLVSPHRPALLLAVALAAVPVSTTLANLWGILTLQARVDLVNRGILISGLIYCVMLALLAVVGHLTIYTVIVMWAVAAVVPLPLCLRALRPKLSDASWDLALRQLGLAGRFHIGVIAQYCLLWSAADVLLLNAMTSPFETGLYSVAISVIMIGRVPADAITQVILPRQADGDVTESGAATARALRIALLSSSVCACLLAAVSPLLVPRVFGAAYEGSILPLVILAPGIIAYASVRLTEQYLVRQGHHPLSMSACTIGALAVNVALDLLLIPRWGAAGAALSSSLSCGLLAVVKATWFTRAHRSSAELQDAIQMTDPPQGQNNSSFS
ncbi:lipopolysaccharide biosynthesis protein [Nonomuraea turcica]|uniref:lipopolysaccharide biosynthesis protein n=1 Tax=Nonomuraea sp. G32 TaxID=3067274 RepID=UPI00273C3D71|nr:polysaccharide biosynthesis C-terminal domain-containing protein [Nonomuraea sp. G32]MDP4511941.1 polysaccharide biosynthesis C-terminal domain-containing protein [Nonomuraea sp. G32]